MMKFVFVLFLLRSIFSTALEDPLPKMVGGINTVVGEYPSAVAIYTPVRSLCGGVILNEKHVITSCQCVTNDTVLSIASTINPFWLRIVAGDLNINTPSYGRFTTFVTDIFIHGRYDPFTKENDIALLRVSDPFPLPHNSIDIALMNERLLPHQTLCEFAGWGAQSTTGPINANQQKLITPILDRILCNNVATGAIRDSMICAGSLSATSPPSGVCVGNLGGGLFCNNQLTGILSKGLGCGSANNPGIYTQIRFFTTWIEEQMLRKSTN